MAYRHRKTRLFLLGFVALFAVAAAFIGPGIYRGAMTIHELLAENKQLKQAITNLTREDQIGYAKVISQRREEGRLLTTVRFVETARDDKTKTILQKEYTVEGDIVHFDALIVTFGDQMVMDGRARALYLWHRVYGERMTPENGYTIEEPGVEPRRYSDLLKALPIKQRELFWASIWDLANDREKLRAHDIKAIYGKGVYTKLTEGLVYLFKITPAGHLTLEAVPDL